MGGPKGQAAFVWSLGLRGGLLRCGTLPAPAKCRPRRRRRPAGRGPAR
ncbi:MAG: hypothetical protein AB1416_01695 [Actinomycetota bacterium]